MSLHGRWDGRKITAGFPSPTNYTPTAVGNEDTNKVSAHLKGIDNALAGSSGAAYTIKETITQASHGFAAGDVIKRGSGAYSKAQADTDANCVGTVGVVESVDGNDFVVVHNGKITIAGASWTDGSVYYLSDSAAGAVTTTAPTIAKPIFVATSATTGIVLNQRNTSASSGGGGKFSIDVNQIGPDDTYPATNVSVAGVISGIAFSGSSNNIVWAQFPTNDMLDDTKDINFEVTYCMSSAESSKKVSMNSDIWVFSDGSDPSKAADYSGLEDEISVPNDGTLDKLALTNIKVAAAALSGYGQTIVVKLWRDVAGASPAHSGDFQLVTLRAYQV